MAAANRYSMKKAFTLMEVVVVVVILGILAAIALPVFTGAMERPIVSEGVSALQTLHASMLRYKLENGAYPSGDDCTKLDTSMLPRNFNNLQCLTATGAVSLSRTNGKYGISEAEDGTFVCTDLIGSLCSSFQLPH